VDEAFARLQRIEEMLAKIARAQADTSGLEQKVRDPMWCFVFWGAGWC
jgi:hypothetical protein